jgi:hypothetical protein
MFNSFAISVDDDALCLFICSLFNDALSDTVSSERMSVNDKFERMWKEAVVAWF